MHFAQLLLENNIKLDYWVFAEKILENKLLAVWKTCPIMSYILLNFAIRSVTCYTKTRKLLLII